MNRRRSSTTSHSFQGMALSAKGESVTHVSGMKCYPSLGKGILDATGNQAVVSKAAEWSPIYPLAEVISNYVSTSSWCFRHQLLLPRPYLVLTKPLRLDIQCQRAASVKIGWKYLDD